MTLALESLLSACDDSGVALRLSDAGKIVFRPSPLPDDLRTGIITNKVELTELLARSPRPDPDPVWFVAKNLDVTCQQFGLCPTLPAVWKGDWPYYRLTPRVFTWLCRALDQRRDTFDPDDWAAVGEQLDRLGSYVRAHFRPDQFDRAVRRRMDLPPVGRVPPDPP